MKLILFQIIDGFEEAPKHFMRLDVRSLLQEVAITEVYDILTADFQFLYRSFLKKKLSAMIKIRDGYCHQKVYCDILR